MLSHLPFVMAVGSQGLAQQLRVGAGCVNQVLMETRWLFYDSPLIYRLDESGLPVPAARRGWADHHRMGKKEHRWFLIGRQEMVDVPSW